MTNKFLVFSLSLFFVVSLLTSCHKDNISSSSALSFSVSQLSFDTVFTSLGSVTKSFTVRNTGKNPLYVNILLAGGSSSYFSMNVDGVAGNNFKNIEIPGNDSLFVFVKVNINPNDLNTPFLVTDSILFTTNGNVQDVDLLAYGQNAHYIVADKWSGNLHYKRVAAEHETVVWRNDGRPYVVFGWAAVDSLGKLIIEAGTQVYFHKNSGIWVYRYGNIEVNGTAEQPVVFQGDRRESWYQTDYAQWDRIWINEGSEDNRIDYAVVTNAYVGIQTEALLEYTDNKTIINNTIIKNSGNSGLIARFANVEMENCLIMNNGSCSAQLQVGEFSFKHVTMANYFLQTTRQNPVLYLSNQYGGQSYRTTASFINTIIYGYLDEEITLNKDNSQPLNYTFENCLLHTTLNNDNFINCLRSDPLFKNNYKMDYQLQSSSPAINAGKDIGITIDLTGKSRTLPYDIGAYEY